MSLRELSVAAGAHSDAIFAVDWSSGDVVLSGGADELLKVWTLASETGAVDASKAKFIASGTTMMAPANGNDTPRAAQPAVLSVLTLANAASPLYATSSMDHTLRVYDPTTLDSRKVEAGAGESWTMTCDPTGAFLATGNSVGAVNIYDVASLQLVATLPGDRPKEGEGATAMIMSIAWSPDGRFIATGHFDGRVTLFPMAGQQAAGPAKPLATHTKAVRAIKFSPDNSLLFTGSDDMHVHWYETATGTGQLVHSLFAHQSWVTSIDIPRAASSSASASPTCFVSVSTDRKVKLWNLATKECIAVAELDSSAWAVACDPTGEKVVVGTEQGSLAVFKIATQ